MFGKKKDAKIFALEAENKGLKKSIERLKSINLDLAAYAAGLVDEIIDFERKITELKGKDDGRHI